MKKHRILNAFLVFILMAAMLIVGCQNETGNPSDGTTDSGTLGSGTNDAGTEGVPRSSRIPKFLRVPTIPERFLRFTHGRFLRQTIT